MNFIDRYKVLWNWLRTVFPDSMPPGFAMVVIPRIKSPRTEDVYVYDLDGRQWRSKRSLKLHFDTFEISGRPCICEGCVKRNRFFATSDV